MEQLHEFLNKQVSNLAVLFTKLHHHHWYVKGRHFFSLHEKFEEYYDEVNELYDEFGERLLTIGGNPHSTMKDYLKHTSLKEASGITKAEDMVKSVLDDFQQIVNELKEGIPLAQDIEDEATADLFISTIASLEKHIWMLKFLQG